VAQLRIEHKDPASNAVEDRIDTIGTIARTSRTRFSPYRTGSAPIERR
jgi:hypothetical protein